MNELVKLAREKQYYAFHAVGPQIKDSWFVELCLLQKWLREKHNIVVSIRPHFYGMNVPYTVKYNYVIFVHGDNREYESWEQCLETALLEALNMIKI